MITVEVDRDKVLLVSDSKKKDWLLTCDQAFKIAIALETGATEIEKEPPSVIKGELWACRVESFDGLVAIRIEGPELGSSYKVPLPCSVARKLADIIKFKAQQAEHKMRIVMETH